MDDIKVYSIHFPGKQVYVDSTVYTFDEKIKMLWVKIIQKKEKKDTKSTINK